MLWAFLEKTLPLKRIFLMKLKLRLKLKIRGTVALQNFPSRACRSDWSNVQRLLFTKFLTKWKVVDNRDLVRRSQAESFNVDKITRTTAAFDISGLSQKFCCLWIKIREIGFENSSPCRKLSVKTLMEKRLPIVREKYEIQLWDVSKYS